MNDGGIRSTSFVGGEHDGITWRQGTEQGRFVYDSTFELDCLLEVDLERCVDVEWERPECCPEAEYDKD